MENLSISNNDTPLWMRYKQYGLDKVVRDIKPPFPGVDFAIIELEGGSSLAVMLKQEQVMDLSDTKQIAVMEWVQRIRSEIEKFGIKCDIVGRKAKL